MLNEMIDYGDNFSVLYLLLVLNLPPLGTTCVVVSVDVRSWPHLSHRNGNGKREDIRKDDNRRVNRNIFGQG